MYFPSHFVLILRTRTLFCFPCLVEEADDLARDVLAPGLLVIHDASRGGQDNVAELTGGQQLDNPLLHITELHVVARVDNAGLVQARFRKTDLALALFPPS